MVETSLHISFVDLALEWKCLKYPSRQLCQIDCFLDQLFELPAKNTSKDGDEDAVTCRESACERHP